MSVMGAATGNGDRPKQVKTQPTASQANCRSLNMPRSNHGRLSAGASSRFSPWLGAEAGGAGVTGAARLRTVQRTKRQHAVVIPALTSAVVRAFVR
jgi:hypothetical protein